MNIPYALIKPYNATPIVAFEGVDGSGKTSLCQKLAEHDAKIFFACIPEAYTQMPFKDYLANNTTHLSSALIYAASLADRKKLITKTTDCNFAITDRSIWSTLALLSVQCPDLLQPMLQVFGAVATQLPIPDVVYVLDVPYEVCIQRILRRRANLRKYDDLTPETYQKHMAFYRRLKELGVNIKFLRSEHMSYDDEIHFVLGDMYHEK
ncbi:MAG: AAA family ATPase [Oscillospiraceae bacterium]|nr:AAA family ATPase [Oscillospiraceae bacterium]